jgi:GTP-binding protein
MKKAGLPVIAIVGRPNVGKSTLFNKLLGKRVAIVHDQPGITRDRNEAHCRCRDRAFTLIDTGGMILHEDDPFAICVQSKKAIDEADRVLFLLDATAGITALDEEIYALLRKADKPVYIVVNKTEGSGMRRLNEFYQFGAEALYPISAEHSQGLGDLLDALYPHLPLDEKKPVAAIPKVVVIGRPNVGKSTLINTLLKEERLITSAIPGTTRDTIDTLVSQGKKQYLFIDTAGIRKRGKVTYGVEQYSVVRSRDALDRADIALFMLDGSEGATEQDSKIAGSILTAGKGLVLLINKSDLLTDDDHKLTLQRQLDLKFPFLKHVEPIYISGLKGKGLGVLFKRVDTVYERFNARVGTSDLNRFFERLIDAHPPPMTGRRRPKLYYITQALSRPPTFVVFANTIDIADSYLQYIENRLREHFDFPGVPIRLKIRDRGRRE